MRCNMHPGGQMLPGTMVWMTMLMITQTTMEQVWTYMVSVDCRCYEVDM